MHYLQALIWVSVEPSLCKMRFDICDEQLEILRAHALSFYSRTYCYVRDLERDVGQFGHDFACTQQETGVSFTDREKLWGEYTALFINVGSFYPLIEEINFK